MTLPLLILRQKIVKLARKLANEHKLKTLKKHSQGEDCKNRTDEPCKENNFLISLRPVNKGMWRENCFYYPRASRAEYNKAAWDGQTSTTSYNILQNKRNVVWYNICSVKKFDSDQTSCNKIQHDTTRYNKVAKRVQHFIQHQSCMMLYEMSYSFGRGLKLVLYDLIFLVNFLVMLKKRNPL